MVGQDVEGTDGVVYTSFALQWPEVIAGCRTAEWVWRAGDGEIATDAAITLVMRRPGHVLPRGVQSIQFGACRTEAPAWHLILPRGEHAVHPIAVELARLLFTSVVTTVSDRTG